MQTDTNLSFNDLVEKYLGQRLPEDMAAPISMESQPPEAKEFINRLLQLMKRAGYPAASFTPYFTRWLSTIKTMLPCAWDGQIPPITVPNRHSRLDGYVERLAREDRENLPVFIDMGCGFPPVTTAETAKMLTGWQVFGVDHYFPDYILYNQDDHYACFNERGEFQYFQAMMATSGRTLYQDPQQTKNYFSELFLELSSLMAGGPPATDDEQDFRHPREAISETAEKDGCRLIRNHIRDFEMDNLRFVRSDINTVELPPAQVIRCMNVYIYFEHGTQKQMLSQAAELLDDGGLLIVGTNGLALQSRYSTYQRDGDSLVSLEFAFSPDNLGPISFMPWFTLHQDDREALLLTKLCRTIRADDKFWAGFDNRIEQILERDEVCWRGPDGFFQIPEEQRSFAEYLELSRAMWRQVDAEGYIDGAVEVLKKAGFEAMRNPIGDIAVKPGEGVMT